MWGLQTARLSAWARNRHVGPTLLKTRVEWGHTALDWPAGEKATSSQAGPRGRRRRVGVGAAGRQHASCPVSFRPAATLHREYAADGEEKKKSVTNQKYKTRRSCYFFPITTTTTIAFFLLAFCFCIHPSIHYSPKTSRGERGGKLGRGNAGRKVRAWKEKKK
uniref:Mitogen-activated protein kinase n=1 Tax=Oryza glumipatula TaxID=40148 RepID=A0A0E0AE64_9ORYZ